MYIYIYIYIYRLADVQCMDIHSRLCRMNAEGRRTEETRTAKATVLRSVVSSLGNQ